jgi:hypothetical protein
VAVTKNPDIHAGLNVNAAFKPTINGEILRKPRANEGNAAMVDPNSQLATIV